MRAALTSVFDVLADLCCHHGRPFDHFRNLCIIFYMLHFQRAIKLYLYQLAVNCEGETIALPIKTKSHYELIRRTICAVMYLLTSLSTEYHLTDSSAIFGILPPLYVLYSTRKYNKTKQNMKLHEGPLKTIST
jgi:hypothetical protein